MRKTRYCLLYTSSKLLNKEAIETITLLYSFSSILEQVAEKNEPSILARYLINLSQSYSSFYNEHHIIVEDKKIQDARLMLTYICGCLLYTSTMAKI